MIIFNTQGCMDPQSDSSDEGDYATTTNVLLGYASEEPLDDTTSCLGGSPVSEWCLVCSEMLI